MQLILDLKIYPKQVVLKTCYTLMNQGCFFLQMASKNKILVELNAKDARAKVALKKKFMVALVNNAVRAEVFDDQRNVIEQVVKRALASDMLSQGRSFQGITAAQQDPLGISKTWEEVHAPKERIQSSKRS